MRIFATLAVLALSAATPAMAEEAANVSAAAVHPRTGSILRDANMVRIGEIVRVYGNGSVQVILDSKLVVVPADTLSMAEGKLKTSLTRREVNKL